MILEIKVIPNAPKNEFVQWEGNCLVVKIRGVPERGKVNENLIAFVAKIFGTTQSQIEILSGKTSRFKKLDIKGISMEDVRRIVIVPSK